MLISIGKQSGESMESANSVRTNFFANRIVNVWNSLPTTVHINSLAAFNRTVKRADLSAFLLCNCT